MTTPSLRTAGTVGTSAVNAGTLIVTVPSCAPGDVLVAKISTQAAAFDPVPTVTGWTQVASAAEIIGGGSAHDGARLTVFIRVAVTGDTGTTVTFTVPNTSAYGAKGVIDAYQNASLIDSSNRSEARASSLTAATVVTTAANELIVESWAVNGGSATITAPATARTTSNPTATLPGLASSDQTQASSGTSTAVTLTASTVRQIAAVTFALRGNQPPNAPTLNAPANSTTLDRTATQRFSWTFSDPDPGDSQSAFDLRYSSDGGATWTTISATSPNMFLDVAAGTFTASSYQWQVRTYDSLGTVGPWAASNFFTASTPSGGPTITTPTSGATIATTPSTVTWSFTTQQGYQVRRVGDISGAADTSTVYYDTGQVTDTVTRSISIPFETNNRFEHVQVRVESGGLWSAWSDVRVDVSYTAPPTPTISLIPDSANAQIGVNVSTPAGGTVTVPTVPTSPTALTAAVTASTEAAITSGSFSLTTGGLIVVLASLFTSNSAGATTLSISDTMGGLTWTQVTANKGTTGNETIASIFYAVSNGVAGTVTVTPSRTGAASTGMALDVYGTTGQGGVGATGTQNSSITVSLSAAPASTSLVVALLVTGNGSDPGNSAPTGMSALVTDRHTGSFMYVTAAYKNQSASQTNTFGGAAINPAAVAIEITAGSTSTTAPSASYIDIYRSDDGAVTSERIATNQPTTVGFIDPTPASGVDYSYQAVAVATSGVTAASAWAD